MPHVPAPIDHAALAALFTEARTARTWTDDPVTDAQLREIYDLAVLPPTASNSNPLRALFLQSSAARDRLIPLMDEGNREKTLAAPAVALLAADTAFHEHMDLLTGREGSREHFGAMEWREEIARFNASLQAGYFILAVRAVGLAAGPMTGFDFAGVGAEFLPEPNLEPLCVVNIGHPGEGAWREPRMPRLPFDTGARII